MNPPMRMFVLLAILWGAGSLLLAAESPSTTPKPAAEAAKKTADPAPKADAKTEGKTQDESKSDTPQSKGSIADQAEAALKAAAEADPGSSTAGSAPNSDAQAAKVDTQAPPTASASKGPSPQRFVPSEQVRADFDVSFPIDI